MTTAEREAFDALLKYAEMEEDWWEMDKADFVKKYSVLDYTRWDVVLEKFRRIALAKAREVSG